jgi:hypothetical protein
MLCGGNFIATETLPRPEFLEAGTYATMVILPFLGWSGAVAADGRARGVVAKRRGCAEPPDA